MSRLARREQRNERLTDIKIYSLLTEQDEKLKKVHHEQAQLLQQPQLDAYNALSTQQRALKEQMDAEVRALTQLSQQVK